MEILDALKSFNHRFNPIFLGFLEKEKNDYKAVDPHLNILYNDIERTFKSGGKRLRPALLYYTYQACGGHKPEAALKAGVALEFFHTFAVIHDDIIDRSPTRRGQPTSIEYFKSLHLRDGLVSDKNQFALSASLLAGDLALTLADKILTDSPFPKPIILRAKKVFDRMRLETVAGEFLDVFQEYRSEQPKTKEIQTIMEYKPGRYTGGRPLELGAVLAQAPKNLTDQLFKIGCNFGTAFQIQDDILGVFGKKEEIGKSADSDLVEGKKTLLIAKAYETATIKEQRFLSKYLGNSQATSADLNDLRMIIKRSGALTKSINYARTLILKARNDLKNLRLEKEAKTFLLSGTTFMLERKF